MRYYGNKEKLLDLIEIGVKKTELNSGAKFVDLFSGTTVVAQHFKRKGFTVIANDFLEFSYAMAKTYIELNEEPKFIKLKKFLKNDNNQNNNNYVIDYLNNLSAKSSFIFDNYCPGGKGKRKYFSNENGQKIDAVREKIEEWKNLNAINEQEYYYLITALIEGINLVSNVAGTYGAYLKQWDKRSLKPLILKAPVIITSKKNNRAFKKDANQLIKEIKNIDILYLDPPYNSRQYVTNYFILELIAQGWFGKEKLFAVGKTGMIKYSQQYSDYCYKNKAEKALKELISNVNSKYILMSYNNEGLIANKDIIRDLEQKGEVQLFRKNHKRYRSINQGTDDSSKTEERLYFVETNLSRKRANKLDGASWLQNSFSIWHNISKNQEEMKLKHPAIFPIQLSERLIDVLTNGSGKNILDCFAGSGSTLIAGLRKGMNVYGFDISKEFQKIFIERLNNQYSDCKNGRKIEYFVKDARDITSYIHQNTIDLCITSPPYWDILNSRRSADLKIGRNYTDKNKDIGNIDSYDIFLIELKKIMTEVAKTIRDNGYCVIIVMDIRKGGKFYPFHSDIAIIMNDIGLTFEDLIIWDRQKEYNNCKPLGYPYKFIVNKIHEYILIFRKNGHNK